MRPRVRDVLLRHRTMIVSSVPFWRIMAGRPRDDQGVEFAHEPNTRQRGIVPSIARDFGVKVNDRQDAASAVGQRI